MWDLISKFPESIHLPLAQWVDSFVHWLTVAGGSVFEAIGHVLRAFLLDLEHLFVWLPWPVVILILAGIGWRLGGWRLGAGIAAALVFVGSLGLWEVTMDTLALVGTSAILALVIGIPVGIAMARNDLVERMIQPLLDLMQTMPSFVYLIPALLLFGLGEVPALIATFIYAVPPAIRLTNLGIRHVPREVIEAGQAFGTTSSQLLYKVQLPLAMPSIMAGVNQTIMMALAMVVIASMIGAGGLGQEVLTGIARLEVGKGFAGGIGIVVLAIVIDRITQNLVKPRRQAAAA